MTSPQPYRPDAAMLERYLELYRRAHAQPELSFAEYETTQLIEAELDRLGIGHQRVSETGTVAVLENGAGPVVAFRADIDGLPVTEESGLDYASTATGSYDGETTGVMHACGHDTHFVCALAAADHLLQHRDAWSGTLVLVFQPAEEQGSGARAMLDGGLWDAVPRPEVVLGQHVMPMPAGWVSLRPENLMSLADTLRVTVTGVQSHGSQPQNSVDPIVTMAAMILRLQTIVAREVAPGSGVVVTTSVVRAGAGHNVIPRQGSFILNVRTPDEQLRGQVVDAIRRIITAEATASRAEVGFETLGSFPRCYNDPEQTDRVTSILAEAFGDDRVVVPTAPATASEDVGELADDIGVPLVYWMFGGFAADRFADGATPAPNHSPHFAPDAEEALTTGITAAVAVLGRYLGADTAAEPAPDITPDPAAG